jgi:hypothetical protein
MNQTFSVSTADLRKSLELSSVLAERSSMMLKSPLDLPNPNIPKPIQSPVGSKRLSSMPVTGNTVA